MLVYANVCVNAFLEYFGPFSERQALSVARLLHPGGDDANGDHTSDLIATTLQL